MMMTEKEESKLIDDEVLSSDDEQERAEEEKAKFTATVTLGSLNGGGVRNVLVVAAGNGQSLTKILFDGMPEVGKAEVTQTEKTKDVLKIFYVQEHQLLVLHPEGVKGAHAYQIIPQLFAKIAEQGSNNPRIVILDSQYKTNYSTTDTGSWTSVDGDAFPLKYYKTSHTSHDQVLSAFLPKYQPAGVLNLLGGLQAALLVHAEINGQSAVCIHSIVDSHYVSAETLQAYSPVVTDVLQITTSKIDQIQRLPSFKPVLKEANNRDHNIFN